MRELSAHLFGLHFPAPEPALIFKQDLELPSRLPFKYFSVPMLLNFSAKKGTGVSNGPL